MDELLTGSMEPGGGVENTRESIVGLRNRYKEIANICDKKVQMCYETAKLALKCARKVDREFGKLKHQLKTDPKSINERKPCHTLELEEPIQKRRRTKSHVVPSYTINTLQSQIDGIRELRESKPIIDQHKSTQEFVHHQQFPNKTYPNKPGRPLKITNTQIYKQSHPQPLDSYKVATIPEITIPESSDLVTNVIGATIEDTDNEFQLTAQSIPHNKFTYKKNIKKRGRPPKKHSLAPTQQVEATIHEQSDAQPIEGSVIIPNKLEATSEEVDIRTEFRLQCVDQKKYLYKRNYIKPQIHSISPKEQVEAIIQKQSHTQSIEYIESIPNSQRLVDSPDLDEHKLEGTIEDIQSELRMQSVVQKQYLYKQYVTKRGRKPKKK